MHREKYALALAALALSAAAALSGAIAGPGHAGSKSVAGEGNWPLVASAVLPSDAAQITTAGMQ